MKALRHFGLLLWLALALAWGQQAAVLHDLGHATAQLAHQQDPSKPAPSSKCDECGLFAEFSGALAAKAVVAPFVAAAAIAAPALVPASVRLAPRLAFLSRAPPSVL
jgi:hypothetical protein